MTRGQRNRLTLLRLLLSPRTSWYACRVMRQSPTPLTFDAAWRYARVRRHPDEASYRLHGHRAESYGAKDRL